MRTNLKVFSVQLCSFLSHGMFVIISGPSWYQVTFKPGSSCDKQTAQCGDTCNTGRDNAFRQFTFSLTEIMISAVLICHQRCCMIINDRFCLATPTTHWPAHNGGFVVQLWPQTLFYRDSSCTKKWVSTTYLLWQEALGNSNCGSSSWLSLLEPTCLLITCWTTSFRAFPRTTVTLAPWTTEVFSGIYPRMRSCVLASRSGRTGSRTPVWCLLSLSTTCCGRTPPMPLIFQRCRVSMDGFMTTAHSRILWWHRWILSCLIVH